MIQPGKQRQARASVLLKSWKTSEIEAKDLLFFLLFKYLVNNTISTQKMLSLLYQLVTQRAR